jgi:hypothetical protein
MQYKPLKISASIPKALEDLAPDFDVRSLLSSNWSKSSHRILFVNTHIETEDIENGRMLSSKRSINTFENIINLSKSIAGFKGDYAICFTAFHTYKTYTLSTDNLKIAKTSGAKRILALINKLNPTYVVVTNPIDLRYIFREDPPKNFVPNSYGDIADLYGFPFESSKFEGVTYVACLPYNIAFMSRKKTVDEDDADDEKITGRANLLGTNARFLSTAFNKRPELKIKAKYVHINTKEKWDRLYKTLCNRDTWAYDLETNGLFNYGIKMCLLSYL